MMIGSSASWEKRVCQDEDKQLAVDVKSVFVYHYDLLWMSWKAGLVKGFSPGTLLLAISVGALTFHHILNNAFHPICLFICVCTYVYMKVISLCLSVCMHV